MKAKPKKKVAATGADVLLDDPRCKIIRADMLEYLDSLEADSLDACVTDPPYELNFMSKGWDNAGVSFDPKTWEKVYRVLKPGAHIVAFGGTRTFHRITVAIEDAGFEIRDCLQWVYGQGFPKSRNIGKAIDAEAGVERKKKKYKARPETSGTMSGRMETRPWIEESRKKGYHEVADDIPVTPEAKYWDGWGTALKPAWEPIILARKPISEKTVADNVLKYGTGAINVGACKIGTEKIQRQSAHNDGSFCGQDNAVGFKKDWEGPSATGRWPANFILSHSPECVCVGTREVKTGLAVTKGRKSDYDASSFKIVDEREESQGYGGTGRRESTELYACVPGCPVRMLDEQSNPASASRFFYTAKASTGERSLGLPLSRRNMHPTVKPVSLMRWLCRLLTPPDGLILDPFAGSGTTGVAAVAEGFRGLLIERDADSDNDCVLRVNVALKVGVNIGNVKRFKLKRKKLKTRKKRRS